MAGFLAGRSRPGSAGILACNEHRMCEKKTGFLPIIFVARVTHARAPMFAYYTFRFAPRVAITLPACYARRFILSPSSRAL